MCEPGAVMICGLCLAAGSGGIAGGLDARIGARIRQRRLVREWPLARAAARIGLAPGRLSAIESGEVRPSAVELYDIARALGVTIGYFFS